MSFQVICYDLKSEKDRLGEPKTFVVIADRLGSKSECRGIMKQFCGRAWIKDRRPDLHSFGDVVITFRFQR